MNSLKSLGVFALLAAVAFAISQAPDIYQVILAITLVIIVYSLVSYVVSHRRRLRDQRIAGV